MTSTRKPGRPRIYTDAERKQRNSQSVMKSRKSHRDQYNKTCKNWNQRNRAVVNARQNARNKRIREEKKLSKTKDIFKALETKNQTPEELDIVKQKYYMMADIIKFGCTQKKTRGDNYKNNFHEARQEKFMEHIFGKGENQKYIIRKSYEIPLEILGWRDVIKHKIYYGKMVAYGVLVYKLNIPKELVKIIIGYISCTHNNKHGHSWFI